MSVSSASSSVDKTQHYETHLHVLQLFFVSLNTFFAELFTSIVTRVIASMACRLYVVVVSTCTLTLCRAMSGRTSSNRLTYSGSANFLPSGTGSSVKPTCDLIVRG